jgi:hypothetical protein
MEVLKGTIFGNECDEIIIYKYVQEKYNFIFGMIFVRN